MRPVPPGWLTCINLAIARRLNPRTPESSPRATCNCEASSIEADAQDLRSGPKVLCPELRVLELMQPVGTNTCQRGHLAGPEHEVITTSPWFFGLYCSIG
jgi:hypothetical protein